jgi:hypothetical protein
MKSPGHEQFFQPHRCRVAQFKVFGEIEIRQCRYYMTEDEKGEKSKENHGHELTGQKVPDDINRLEMDKNTTGKKE